MRKQFLMMALMTFFLLLVILSCEKNATESSANIPEVTTAEVSAITGSSAQCGGNIISDGGATVTARGVCWSTGQNPTVSDSKTTNGTGAGSFTSDITGLTASTTYL